MVSSSNQFKIAVYGTGSIGTRHLQILKELGIPSIAVPTRRNRFEELRSFGYSTEMTLEKAAAAGAKGVIIATDTGRHISDIRKAITVGLYILCEKPIASRVLELDVLQALNNYVDKIFVGYCLRFDKGLQEFRKKITKLGQIHNVNITCRSYLPKWRSNRDYRKSYSAKKAEGGVLLDLSHELDYAIWLFGKPKRIIGKVLHSGLLDIETEDVAAGIWSTEKSLSVSVNLDYLTKSNIRFIQALGEKGILSYNFIKHQLNYTDIQGNEESFSFDIELNDVYKAQIKEFINIIKGGKRKHLAAMEEAVMVLKLCDAIKESSRAGKEVFSL